MVKALAPSINWNALSTRHRHRSLAWLLFNKPMKRLKGFALYSCSRISQVPRDWYLGQAKKPLEIANARSLRLRAFALRFGQ